MFTLTMINISPECKAKAVQDEYAHHKLIIQRIQFVMCSELIFALGGDSGQIDTTNERILR